MTKKKARMKTFGPERKTAGFPQLRTSLCAQQPSELHLQGQYLYSDKLLCFVKKVCGIVRVKVEHTLNLTRHF